MWLCAFAQARASFIEAVCFYFAFDHMKKFDRQERLRGTHQAQLRFRRSLKIFTILNTYHFLGNQADCQTKEDIEKFYEFVGNSSKLMKKLEIMPNCETKIWKLLTSWEDNTDKKSDINKFAFFLSSEQKMVTFTSYELTIEPIENFTFR